MENFKSFGKKKTVPLQEGYTNITGPNGSGKSNIGDAILFVLGPKSSKEIRAGRLTDLIFNGGKEGKPADHCRVSLTFDNEDKSIPLDEEEITFTRKIKRSDNQIGYNSYFYINGRSSKLSEFQNLLNHARISSSGYNIVQQGDIAKIVEMSDVERRTVLDQISGISEYDKEIDEAEEKKESVLDDLDRINILLDEISTQVKELESDRQEALKYQELSDKVAEAKQKKAWKTKNEIMDTIKSIQDDIEDNKEKRQEIEDKKKNIREEIKNLKDEIKKIDDEIDERGGEKNEELREEVNSLRLDVGRAEDKIEDAKHTIKEDERLRKKLKQEVSTKKEELSELGQEIVKLEKEKEEAEEKAKEVREKIENIRGKQSKSDGRIKSLRKEGVEVKNKLDEKNDALSEKERELDRKKDKIDRLAEEISDLEEDKEQFEFEKKDLEWKLKDLKEDNQDHESKLEELKKSFHDERNKEKRLREDKSDLEERVNRLEREYNKLKAQEEAAKSVKRGYNRAVSSILEARDKGELEGVHGTIAELADVEDKYETALQVSAGGRMQSIVVENDGVATEAIKYLKKNKIGRATFLPMNKMRNGRPRGKALRAVKDEDAVDFALDLVDYDDEYENVFWYVFQDTVVMKDIDSARKNIGGVRMVTLDGEKIERSGAMVGGDLKKNMMSFSAPDRGKLDRVSKELQQTRENLKKVTSELNSVEKDVQDIQDKIREVQAEGGTSEKVGSLEGEIERWKKKITSVKEKLDDKREEKEDLEEDVVKAERSVSHIKEEIEKLKKERKEIAENIKDISPEELSTKLGELKDEEVEFDKKVNKLSSEIEVKKNDKERLEEDIEGYEKDLDDLKDEIEKSKSSIKKKEKIIEEKEERLKDLRDDLSSMDDELEELRAERDEKKENRIDLEHKIDKLDDEKEAKKSYIITLKQKLDDHRDTVSELEEDIDEEKDFTGEDLPPLKELKHIIKRGENRMESLQPVNMRALDDYKKKKERKDKLQEEYTDLEERRDELDNLIEELDEKKKIGLLEVKKEINENFKSVYEELSDGGDAHLELENKESPFEGGLIIKARPPGKKVHRIQALSGGEKGLVSMAFIFAIQRYDPSPFYLLDEIDQNLDGVNAENVADMIKRNSQYAQFIQVSLRKVTLKKSDHIIGVTMRDDGISDLIMKVNIGEKVNSDIPELSGMSKLETEV